MFKKLLLVLGLLFITSFIFAEPAAFPKVAKLKTITISSSTWTPIPAIADIANARFAIQIDLSVNVTDYLRLTYSTSTVIPGVATTIGHIYKETDPPWTFPIGNGVYLYGIMSGSSSGDIYVTEFSDNF